MVRLTKYGSESLYVLQSSLCKQISSGILPSQTVWRNLLVMSREDMRRGDAGDAEGRLEWSGDGISGVRRAQPAGAGRVEAGASFLTAAYVFQGYSPWSCTFWAFIVWYNNTADGHFPPLPCYDMKPAPSRKRSRLSAESDDDKTQQQGYALPALSSLSGTSKRSRAQCEVDELDIISVKDAWSVDIDDILSSKRVATPTGSKLEAHDNWTRYERGESIVILCVQGNIHVHYDMLWYVAAELHLHLS